MQKKKMLWRFCAFPDCCFVVVYVVALNGKHRDNREKAEGKLIKLRGSEKQKTKKVKRPLRVIKSLIFNSVKTDTRNFFPVLISRLSGQGLYPGGWNNNTVGHNNMRGDDRHQHVWNVMDNHNTQNIPPQDTDKHFQPSSPSRKDSFPEDGKRSFSHFAPLFSCFPKLTGEEMEENLCGKIFTVEMGNFPTCPLVCLLFWCVCYCCDGLIVF